MGCRFNTLGPDQRHKVVSTASHRPVKKFLQDLLEHDMARLESEGRTGASVFVVVSFLLLSSPFAFLGKHMGVLLFGLTNLAVFSNCRL